MTVHRGRGLSHRLQVRLLNGGAVCNMRMGRWEEAESQLLEAFEKDAKNADTLANLITVSLHLSKPASRYSGCALSLYLLYKCCSEVHVFRQEQVRLMIHLAFKFVWLYRQLKTLAPQHVALQSSAAAEDAFDRAAASFEVA